jgi:hypothetical protein
VRSEVVHQEPTRIVVLASVAVVALLLMAVLKRTPKLGVALLAFGGLLALFLGTFIARQAHIAPPQIAYVQHHAPLPAPRAPVVEMPPVHRLLETYRHPGAVTVPEGVVVAPVEPAIAAPLDPVPVETGAPLVPVDSPFTVYQGLSASGQGVDSPPLWVTQPIEGTSEALPGTLSSERFATVAEAEEQLWSKLQAEVSEVMTRRFPDAQGWQPPRDLLQRASVVLERCVERMEKTFGEHVVPLYRVHWKVALTDPTREMLTIAWMPTVANERMFTVGSVFGGIAGGFLFLNLVLRGLTSALWQRLWSRKTAAAAVAGGLLLAGVGLLVS